MPIQDARRLSATEIQADVAIVGAGAAGIALAREFANQSTRVVVLESGDFDHRHRTQFLYRGENVGRTNISTTFSRFRRFGGSTTRWGGQCRPLDPIDFEARPDMPLSGWPIDYGHLDPYYRRAQNVCKLGRYDYDSRNWHDVGGGPLPVDSDLLQTRVYQFSHPTDFSRSGFLRMKVAFPADMFPGSQRTSCFTDAFQIPVGNNVAAEDMTARWRDVVRLLAEDPDVKVLVKMLKYVPEGIRGVTDDGVIVAGGSP